VGYNGARTVHEIEAFIAMINMTYDLASVLTFELNGLSS
jgi:hypothetical protein